MENFPTHCFESQQECESYTEHVCLSSNRHKMGKTVKQRQASSTKENMQYVVNFFSQMMPKIIHHRNQLKHYRNVIHIFRDHFGAISVDLDFSENLKVPVKFEPQSLTQIPRYLKMAQDWWEVERLTDHKIEKGDLKFKVSWKKENNSKSWKPSWEPAANISTDVILSYALSVNLTTSLAMVPLIHTNKDPVNLEIIPADEERGQKGRGVRTTKLIKKGCPIVHYHGEIKETKKIKDKSDYVYKLNGRFS